MLLSRGKSPGDIPELKAHKDKVACSILRLPGFKKYLANTSWLMVEKIVRGVLLLVVGVYVVRYLGPGQFGLLSYAVSLVALFSSITTLGLGGIVVRELVRDTTKRDGLLGTAFALRIMGAFLALGLLYFVAHFSADQNHTGLLILIIGSCAVFQSFDVIDYHLQSQVLSRYAVYARLVSLVVSSLAKLVLIWIRAPLLYFAIVFPVEGIISAMGLAVAYTSQKLPIFDWRFKGELAAELLRDSWPLVLSGICVSVYMRIDQVMIRQMLNMEAVGQYAAAARLSEAWYFIAIVVCGSVFPAVLNAKQKDKELYHARLQRLYDLMVWTAIPIALVTTLVADDLVRFLFGAQFSRAASVLAVHVWAGVFVSQAVASNKWYLAENLQLFSFINKVFGAVVNVALNLILIRRFGIVGAAWATLISYGFEGYLLNLAYAKTRGNFYRLSRAFNILRVTKRFMSLSYTQRHERDEKGPGF